MTHPYYFVSLPSGGQFIFTPCPGTKGEALFPSLERLKKAGAVGVITMLSDEELKLLEVEEFSQVCHSLGLKWYQLPVEDDCEPEEPFEQAFVAQKSTLAAHLTAGETMVIHCRGGTGRTGLMAAILLLEQGHAWSTVKSAIQSVRPGALTLQPHLDYLDKHYSIRG